MLPVLDPVDLASPSPVAAYLRSITAVCPFIEPATRVNLLYSTAISPDCQTAADIHPRLFEQLVPQIERFRDARAALHDKQHRLLVCHTVVIHMPPHLDDDTTRQLHWPNILGWTLKHFYTPKEIVLGVVRKNAVEKSMGGMTIPVAPFHAVVIRSRVANSDGRFFPGNDAMLKAMMEADDDGRDVHTPLLGTVPDIRNPQAMREANYWRQILQWWQTTLAKK
jgi:hypothetical protein